MTKKLQFGDICLTLTPDDIELVTTKLALKLGREPTSAEFADAMMAHMTENAKQSAQIDGGPGG